MSREERKTVVSIYRSQIPAPCPKCGKEYLLQTDRIKGKEVTMCAGCWLKVKPE